MIGKEFVALEALIHKCCQDRSRKFGDLTAAELLDYVGNAYGRPYIKVSVDTTPSPAYVFSQQRPKAQAKHKSNEPGSGTLKSRLGTIIISDEKPDKSSPYWDEDAHQKQLRKNRSQRQAAQAHADEVRTSELTQLLQDIKDGKKSQSDIFALMGGVED